MAQGNPPIGTRAGIRDGALRKRGPDGSLRSYWQAPRWTEWCEACRRQTQRAGEYLGEADGAQCFADVACVGCGRVDGFT